MEFEPCFQFGLHYALSEANIKPYTLLQLKLLLHYNDPFQLEACKSDARFIAAELCLVSTVTRLGYFLKVATTNLLTK